MKNITRILSVLILVGMILGMIPLLGWLNWINIPFAIIVLGLSVLVKSKGSIIICIVAIFLGLFRLMLGGGII